MRVLTYNLWHGLDAKGVLWFGRLEPDARLKRRLRLQSQTLADLKPDLLLVQELNPLAGRLAQLSRRLGMRGFGQVDNSGLKLLAGPPFNLESGIACLVAKKDFLRKIKAVKLSGDRIASGPLSFQLRESRYALFCEWDHQTLGRILVANLHLHHGLEYTAKLKTQINSWAKHFTITEEKRIAVDEILNAGDQRRHSEMQKFIDVLSGLQNRYNYTIVGGDFNTTPESSVAKRLDELGFVDCWHHMHPEGSDPGYSFDKDKNSTHKLLSGFALPFSTKSLNLDEPADRALNLLLSEHEARPRRIDYLWIKSRLGQMRVHACKLVGAKSPIELELSDHFGVLAELELGSPS